MILEQILRTQVSDINMSDEKLETESIRTKGCAGVTELMEATKQSTEEKIGKEKEENYEADVSGKV